MKKLIDIEKFIPIKRAINFLILLLIGSYFLWNTAVYHQQKEEPKYIRTFHVMGESWMLSETVSGYTLHAHRNEEKEESLILENNIVDSCIADMNKDGSDELLVIEGENQGPYGEELVVYGYDNGFMKLFSQSFAGMNPWKVQTCDVDGDGEKEISVGVYKETEFHPVMDKRPFLYNYHGNAISPKWRGSRLARPFNDYIFVDVDGDKRDEIVSIEILENGENVINTYGWKGFGFEGLAESRIYEKVYEVQKGAKKDEKYTLRANVKTSTGDLWKTLQYVDGILKEIQS